MACSHPSITHTGDDGLPSLLGLPSGHYEVNFGMGCETRSFELGGRSYAGCTRTLFVPCALGSDCMDCGRAASSGRSYGDVASSRRRMLASGEALTLPSFEDQEAVVRLFREISEHEAAGDVRALRLPPAYGFWYQRYRPALGAIQPYRNRTELDRDWRAFRQKTSRDLS